MVVGMTERKFKTQISGQIGESIVVAELGRQNIVATAFSGNVPDIDLLAYANGKSIPLQIKAQTQVSLWAMRGKKWCETVLEIHFSRTLTVLK